MPDAAAATEAESQFHETHQGDLTKARRAADRQTLAEKFFDEATTANDPALRFVLLKHVRALAADLGDTQLLRRTIAETVRRYRVDATAITKESFLKAADCVRNPAAAREFTTACLALVDEAADRDDFALAFAYGQAAYVSSQEARDARLIEEVAARGRQVVARKKDFSDAEAAAKILAVRPEDPDANLTQGRYVCLTKKDWDRGLPLVAKGSDAKWKALAQKDLAQPSTAADRLALGDAWWDLAEAQADSSRAAIRQRAATWYRQALSGLGEDDKRRVTQRLALAKGFGHAATSATGANQAPAEPSSSPSTEKPLATAGSGWVDLLAIVRAHAPREASGWRSKGDELQSAPQEGEAARLAIPVVPSGNYEVSLEFTRTDSFEMLGVIVPVGSRQCLAAINFGGGASGLDMIDGRRASDNSSSFGGVLTNDRRYTLELAVQVDDQEASVTAKLDGRPMFFYRGPVASLALAKPWSIGNRNTLGLVSQAEVTIHSLRLRMISGKAMPAGR